jgi:hypothetical protein
MTRYVKSVILLNTCVDKELRREDGLKSSEIKGFGRVEGLVLPVGGAIWQILAAMTQVCLIKR